MLQPILFGREECAFRVLQDKIESHQPEANRGRLVLAAVAVVLLADRSAHSERYLAQIESGLGNISVLVLRQLAKALNMSVDALLSEGPEPSVELVYIVEFLRRLSPDELKLAHQTLLHQFGGVDPAARHRRIALIGLRGAGKSTLGAALAERLDMPFLELDRLIEQESGLTLNLTFDFRGQTGFRELERQCLEDVLRRYPCFVLATGGVLFRSQARLSGCYRAVLRFGFRLANLGIIHRRFAPVPRSISS